MSVGEALAVFLINNWGRKTYLCVATRLFGPVSTPESSDKMRWFLTLVIVYLSHPSCGEIYTSLVQLENVLEAEGLLADHLENYITHEEERLEKLKR